MDAAISATVLTFVMLDGKKILGNTQMIAEFVRSVTDDELPALKNF